MQETNLIEKTGIKRTAPPTELIENTIWQLEVCNACRYCEGYCAVFPALERRQRPTPADVYFLANLCHDCRPCYYACMFAPPHEFGVNLPQAFSEVRQRTYSRYGMPRFLGGLTGNSLLLNIVVVALALVFFGAIAAITGGLSRRIYTYTGSGSFYEVIPYAAMVLPPLLMAGFGGFTLVRGVTRFWRETHGPVGELLNPGLLFAAAGDALTLRFMRGDSEGGCEYPGERPSRTRWLLHMAVMWGFISALAATIVAVIYQDVIHWRPPYPVTSLPVSLGSLGGIAMIAGSTGLIWLKLKSDPAPAHKPQVVMDYVLLAIIDLVSITGMALLVLRDTPVMSSLLIVHLAFVSALFVTAPYGKLAHLVYRYAALVKNRVEEREVHKE